MILQPPSRHLKSRFSLSKKAGMLQAFLFLPASIFSPTCEITERKLGIHTILSQLTIVLYELRYLTNLFASRKLHPKCMDSLQQKEETRLLALNELNNVSENDAQARFGLFCHFPFCLVLYGDRRFSRRF